MRKIVIAVFGFLVLGGAWSGLWALAANQVGTQFDTWLVREEGQGRQWICPSREIGGYPFALSISCRNATFIGNALGQSVQGTVAGLNAEAGVMHPTSIVLTLLPPFAYRSSDGATDVQGRWTSLSIDLAGLPDIARVSLAGSDIALEGLFGPAGQQRLASTRLDTRFDLPKSGPDPTLAFDIAVGGTAVPQIDALVGDTQPTDLHFKGRLDRTNVGDARTPEEAMDRWRRAGGHIDLTAAGVDRGTSHVTATGRLRLDEAHCAQGHLDAQFLGVEPILKRYGINANLAAAGALLNTLFGGAPSQAPPPPGTIALPINLKDGHIAIGPIRTEIKLEPLY